MGFILFNRRMVSRDLLNAYTMQKIKKVNSGIENSDVYYKYIIERINWLADEVCNPNLSEVIGSFNREDLRLYRIYLTALFANKNAVCDKATAEARDKAVINLIEQAQIRYLKNKVGENGPVLKETKIGNLYITDSTLDELCNKAGIERSSIITVEDLINAYNKVAMNHDLTLDPAANNELYYLINACGHNILCDVEEKHDTTTLKDIEVLETRLRLLLNLAEKIKIEVNAIEEQISKEYSKTRVTGTSHEN